MIYQLSPSIKKYIIPTAKMMELLQDCHHQDKINHIKKWHDDLLENLYQNLLKNQNGQMIGEARALFFDYLLKTIVDSYFTLDDTLCLIATGGYGRGHLCAYSDLDIWFIIKDKNHHYDKKIENILYLLWDCGFTVGHSIRHYHNVIDDINSDHTICTAFLEARYIAGRKTILTSLFKKIDNDINDKKIKNFTQEKLQEREARHHKFGNTRYLVEPNIKEGKGGLRDIHCLAWIALYHYKLHHINEIYNLPILTQREKKLLNKSINFLTNLRCHLHFINKRAEETLTFDVQKIIADNMGYQDHGSSSAVERLMKHYYMTTKEVGDLTRIFCNIWSLIENKYNFDYFAKPENIDGFILDKKRLMFQKNQQEKDLALDIIRIFKTALDYDIDIHPHAIQIISRKVNLVKKLHHDKTANQYFLDILTAKKGQESIIRLMNECGVLGKFIPDFGKIVAQMQFDMYHVYTTDEHTIHAVGNLNKLERGLFHDSHPLSTMEFPKIPDRTILYVALLIHDIAKGRKGDHSILGAKIAEKLCPRFGLNQEQTELVSWLVLEHLTMSKTAFRRDLQDKKTIIDFSKTMQTSEKLRYLLILTVIDIRSVGPNIWKSWQAVLLRMLYQKSFHYLTGGNISLNTDDTIDDIINIVQKLQQHISYDKMKEILSLMNMNYFDFTSPDIVATHTAMIYQSIEEKKPIIISYQSALEDQSTRFDVYCQDHPGLFAKLAGAISLGDAKIINARIHTLNNGMALDSFIVQDLLSDAPTTHDKANHIKQYMYDVLHGNINIYTALHDKATQKWGRRDNSFSVTPRVIFDNDASSNSTVIEIAGRDRYGILYFITNIIHQAGLKINSAKIATYGEKLVDSFYVKDVFGHKIYHQEKQKKLKQSLLNLLEQANHNFNYHHKKMP